MYKRQVIGGKDRWGFSHLAQLPVETHDGIGGADQPAHLLGILEIGAETGPIIPPGPGDFRVFPVPALSKGVQRNQGCLLYTSKQAINGHLVKQYANVIRREKP